MSWCSVMSLELGLLLLNERSISGLIGSRLGLDVGVGFCLDLLEHLLHRFLLSLGRLQLALVLLSDGDDSCSCFSREASGDQLGLDFLA